MKRIFFNLVFGISLIACGQTENTTKEHGTKQKDSARLESLQTAYFASGCFWCVEAIFESIKGVEEAESGYAGGIETNPTYGQVSSGRTGHAETVKVYYDSSKISFSTLVQVFFDSHDPSTLNKQGPDRGPQYRSIAFYENDTEKQIIRRAIDSLKKTGEYDQITTELTLLDKFYLAEDYHQDYEKNHPNDGYIRSVSLPRINKFKEKRPELLKDHH